MGKLREVFYYEEIGKIPEKPNNKDEHNSEHS